MTEFNPIKHPICLELPVWLKESAWTEHVPFAMYLMTAMRPKTFVELGSFRGVSYCAFCQSAKASKVATKCYAVDTWQGDAHAGLLEEGVLKTLKSHHDPLYGDFSQLMQSTFDEALEKFADKSVDLLHIDGFHTYEAVSHDFQTWLPKMSERGIILFHDTNVREGDFGVWKLWDELKAKYAHFEFLHGYGLGVLAVGGKIPDDINFLFESDEKQTKITRDFFHRLGKGIEYEAVSDRLESYEKTVMGSRPIRMMYLLKQKGLANYLKLHLARLDKNKNK